MPNPTEAIGFPGNPVNVEIIETLFRAVDITFSATASIKSRSNTARGFSLMICSNSCSVQKSENALYRNSSLLTFTLGICIERLSTLLYKSTPVVFSIRNLFLILYN